MCLTEHVLEDEDIVTDPDLYVVAKLGCTLRCARRSESRPTSILSAPSLKSPDMVMSAILLEDEGVIAEAADEGIVTLAARKIVVTLAPVEFVVARVSVQLIIAIVAFDDIGEAVTW